MKHPLVFSTSSSRYFAERIASQIPGAELVETERKRFGDRERYLRIVTDDRDELFGKDVVFVASTATDDDIAEVCRMGSAIAKYGARRMIFAIPFFGYSTMERAVHPGEIVTAKIIARQLSQIPQGDVRNCFLMMDLHTAGLVHYFEGECLRFELYAEPVLTAAIRELGISDFMFGSADLSRSLWVASFAKHFGTSLAFIRKSRDFETTKVEDIIGDVRGKAIVIYDDMTRSGTTLVHAAEAYLKNGATAVYAVLSHWALNNSDAFRILLNSPIEKFITTNSHPMSQQIDIATRIIVKDVSPIFADAVQKLL